MYVYMSGVGVCKATFNSPVHCPIVTVFFLLPFFAVGVLVARHLQIMLA